MPLVLCFSVCSSSALTACPSLLTTCLRPGAFNRRVLPSCLVPQCSYPPHRPRHQWRLTRCDGMPASYTSGQPSNPRRHPTCWAPLQRSHTFLGRRALEPGHLLRSVLTCPTTADARHLKSRHPFVPAAQQLTSLSDNNNTRAAQWADHQWNGEWADNPTRFRILIPDTGTYQPGMALSRRSGLTTSAPVSTPAGTNGVWPPLRPVNVAKKNKSSTMLSSNVQSTDLLMDCTAWRFWSMRQSNVCSTPAPKSSAAKQWIEELAQKKNWLRVATSIYPVIRCA